MEIWRRLTDIPHDFTASAVAIGVFDGVHRGHRALISACADKAAEAGYTGVVVTFDPHPLAVIRPDKMPPLLSTVEERAEIAESLGVDALLALPFDRAMAALSPEEFFRSVLVETLRVRYVVVGENFTFGHKAAGTTQTLQELGDIYGVEVEIKRLVADDSAHRVSSSAIRRRLDAGDVGGAAEGLGRHYEVTGPILRGAGRGGKELGYPTANQYFPDTQALPGDGVYAGWFEIVDDGKITGDMQPHVAYPAAISIGTNPTFGDDRRSVESFVLDRDADLYGRMARVTFVEKLRDMEKFSGVDELLAAMERDVARTREILTSDSA